MRDTSRPVLVLGATGYIGSRLIPRLLEAGYPVRALARTPAKLGSRPWAQHPSLEIVRGDLLDPASLTEAASGCQAAYYLVHSMNPGVSDFAATDRSAAENMVAAAAEAGLQRIIYLSGLGEEGAGLSHHLRSRSEVGQILAQGAVPVTILRAAMIIGSGSASFEILRYLVDRLPVMITPRWVSTRCQPIGIRNVLFYLVACLSVSETVGQTFDIGGPEVVTYRQLMRLYAEEAGLPRRLILPVPVLTPRLSSYWIHLVTPVPAAIARPLAEGLSNPVVCRESRIVDLIPQPLFDCRTAIRLALQRVREQQVESTWFDAGAIPPAEWSTPDDPQWAGGAVYEDARTRRIAADIDRVWAAVVRIGGHSGWYFADWLWCLRGLLDRLVGGIGLRRGRRDPERLGIGDALDFWRVADLQRPRRLLLVAEMKLPGQATLGFELQPADAGGTDLRQVARFLPRGLLGIAYWWLVKPLHGLVFDGMLRGIAASACSVAASQRTMPSKPAFDGAEQWQVDAWRRVDDVVMGGCSRSQMRATEAGTALFSGEVSLENNGGFASVRYDHDDFDFAARAGVCLRFRADGKRYRFNLRTAPGLDAVNWQVRFETRPDEWQEHCFAWEAFRPTRHGRAVENAPPFDPSGIVGMGLLIADRQEGPFRFELAWVRSDDRNDVAGQ